MQILATRRWVVRLGRRWCTSGGEGEQPEAETNGFVEREGNKVYMVERVMMSEEGKIVTLVGLPYLGTDQYWEGLLKGCERFDCLAIGEPLGNTQNRGGTIASRLQHGIPDLVEANPLRPHELLHTKHPSPVRLIFNRDLYLKQLAAEASKAYVETVHPKPYPHTGLFYDPSLLPIFKEKLASLGYREYSSTRVYFGDLLSTAKHERSIVSVQYMRCMTTPPKARLNLTGFLVLATFPLLILYFIAPAPAAAQPYPMQQGYPAMQQQQQPGVYYPMPPPVPGMYQHQQQVLPPTSGGA